MNNQLGNVVWFSDLKFLKNSGGIPWSSNLLSNSWRIIMTSCLILDLLGIPFDAVVVLTSGYDFLFKSTLGHCVCKAIFRTTLDKCAVKNCAIIWWFHCITFQAFIVRQSSQNNTLALSVRHSESQEESIEHYLIQQSTECPGKLNLESSDHLFDNVLSLVYHYSTTK